MIPGRSNNSLDWMRQLPSSRIGTFSMRRAGGRGKDYMTRAGGDFQFRTLAPKQEAVSHDCDEGI